jgi:hypothetical protein
MEEKIQNIIIGIVILLLISCLAMLSISSGVFSGSNKSDTNTDNKFNGYEALSESNKKISIITSNGDVNVNIPNNICIDREIDIKIVKGIIVGNTDNVNVNPNIG